METLATWEMVLIGAVVVLVLLWFRPGIKRAFQQGRQGTAADWTGLLLPIGAVVAFVILLILLARA